MTDSATPKKITRTRPTNYPAQMTIMLDAELAETIDAFAVESGRSKSDVVRRALRDVFSTPTA